MASASIGGLTLGIGRGGRTPVANAATPQTACRRLHAVVRQQGTSIAGYPTTVFAGGQGGAKPDVRALAPWVPEKCLDLATIQSFY